MELIKVDKVLGKKLILHNQGCTFEEAFDLDILDIWVSPENIAKDNWCDTLYIKVPKRNKVKFLENLAEVISAFGAAQLSKFTVFVDEDEQIIFKLV